MNLSIEIILLVVAVSFLFGLVLIGFVLNKRKLTASFEGAQIESKKILEEARREADRVVKSAIQEGKEDARRRRKLFEEESKKRKSEIHTLEKKIKQREQTLESRQLSLERLEQTTIQKEKDLIAEEKRKLKLIAEYELSLQRNQSTLEKIANMSAEDAKKELISTIEESAKKAAKETIRQVENQAQKEALQKARDIISLSVQRLAGEHVNDSTITVVTLPSEEMKGRIIGREGRNIRALEQATGVDLIIDDTPEAVILSCFNPIRREVAKLTLEKLIADGRIHPARIDETASRVEAEFNATLKDYGEQAAFEVGITDLHPELLSLLGKLRFRTVGTQSVLQHSIETAHICGMMAAELGINIKKAKRAGLLHDIGKALDQEVEGHHADIGSDICRKFGEHQDIADAIKRHHADDLLHASALTVILGAANTLSANRPAARKEALSGFIKRLETMEEIVRSFQGIQSAYVLQAGREVRALITPEGIGDDEVRDLADDIALKLRRELTFPGQVRITALKESKHVDYAT